MTTAGYQHTIDTLDLLVGKTAQLLRRIAARTNPWIN